MSRPCRPSSGSILFMAPLPGERQKGHHFRGSVMISSAAFTEAFPLAI